MRNWNKWGGGGEAVLAITVTMIPNALSAVTVIHVVHCLKHRLI